MPINPETGFEFDATGLPGYTYGGGFVDQEYDLPMAVDPSGNPSWDFQFSGIGQLLKGLGLDTWESETPAVPIVLGSKELVYRFWQALLDKGVFTVMSIAPAVPPGKDLIRTAVSALHSDEDLEKIAAAMAYAVKQM